MCKIEVYKDVTPEFKVVVQEEVDVPDEIPSFDVLSEGQWGIWFTIDGESYIHFVSEKAYQFYLFFYGHFQGGKQFPNVFYYHS